MPDSFRVGALLKHFSQHFEKQFGSSRLDPLQRVPLYVVQTELLKEFPTEFLWDFTEMQWTTSTKTTSKFGHQFLNLIQWLNLVNIVYKKMEKGGFEETTNSLKPSI